MHEHANSKNRENSNKRIWNGISESESPISISYFPLLQCLNRSLNKIIWWFVHQYFNEMSSIPKRFMYDNPTRRKKKISLRFQIEVVSPISISCTRFPRPDCCPGNPINFVAGGGHLAPHKSGPLWHLRLKSIYKSCRPPPYHPDDESLESLCKRDVCAADPLWKMTRYAFQKLQWTVQKDPLPVLIGDWLHKQWWGSIFVFSIFINWDFIDFGFFFSFYLFKWSGRVVDTLWKLCRRGFQLQSINIDLSFVIKTMINVCVIEVLLVGEVGLFVNAFLCCINVNYCNRIPLNISIYYISSFLDAIEYVIYKRYRLTIDDLNHRNIIFLENLFWNVKHHFLCNRLANLKNAS